MTPTPTTDNSSTKFSIREIKNPIFPKDDRLKVKHVTDHNQLLQKYWAPKFTNTTKCVPEDEEYNDTV